MRLDASNRGRLIQPANFIFSRRAHHALFPQYIISRNSLQVKLQFCYKLLQFYDIYINTPVICRRFATQSVYVLSSVYSGLAVYSIQAASWISCAIGSCVHELGKRVTSCFFEPLYTSWIPQIVSNEKSYCGKLRCLAYHREPTSWAQAVFPSS